MILQREIAEKAKEWKVTATTVDKDYVLGHFLHCFFNYRNNRERFVFKGGTCLRKCYFSNYRFSEDLDFTLTAPDLFIDEQFILKIAHACTRHSGIKFELTKFEKKRFKEEEKGYKFGVAFWGANHSRNKPPAPVERWTTKIELDISFDETIFFPVHYTNIHHPYSDEGLIVTETIPVYALEEILVEKIRSFYQRSYKAPRDFFDVWYLLKNNKFDNWGKITHNLKEKCTYKNKEITPSLFGDKYIYQSVSKSWGQSIENHLPGGSLPEFDEV